MRARPGQRSNLITEGMMTSLCGGVNEENGTMGRMQGKVMQHGDGRSDADASAEKHNRPIAVAENEVSLRNVRVDGVSLLNVVVKMIGDETVVGRGDVCGSELTLDADAVGASIADAGEAVLTDLLEGSVGPMRTHCEVLTGKKWGKRLLGRRCKVE